MASVVIEFRIRPNVVQKIDIRDCLSDKICGELNSGDEIGFDIPKLENYFYIIVARKVFVFAGCNELPQPALLRQMYIITVPIYIDLDEMSKVIEGLKFLFGDKIVVEKSVVCNFLT